MTLPTNNEEAEAPNLLKYAVGLDHPTFGQGFFFTQDAVDSLISDVRRLPVSGDNAALIAKAANWAWFHRHDPEGSVDTAELLDRLSAALSASQPREAAPSDTDLRQAIESALDPVAFRGSGEEVGTEESAILFDDAINALLPLLSRPSHPVQVEVTAAQRRALIELEVPLPNGHQYLRLGKAGADAVIAALGGGDQ